jgi:hypothetical protein
MDAISTMTLRDAHPAWGRNYRTSTANWLCAKPSKINNARAEQDRFHGLGPQPFSVSVTEPPRSKKLGEKVREPLGAQPPAEVETSA